MESDENSTYTKGWNAGDYRALQTNATRSFLPLPVDQCSTNAGQVLELAYSKYTPQYYSLGINVKWATRIVAKEKTWPIVCEVKPYKQICFPIPVRIRAVLVEPHSTLGMVWQTLAWVLEALCVRHSLKTDTRMYAIAILCNHIRCSISDGLCYHEKTCISSDALPMNYIQTTRNSAK